MAREEFYEGETFTFEHNGAQFIATIERDDSHGAPWEECDGHGEVSEWTTRDKLPGELVISEDRGAKRYYDFQGACAIARRDQWGALPGELELSQDIAGTWIAKAGTHECCSAYKEYAIQGLYRRVRESMSPRAYAAFAARKDFEFLQGWCSDTWFYALIKVERADEDGEPYGDAEYLGGVESNSGDYIRECAAELAANIIG